MIGGSQHVGGHATDAGVGEHMAHGACRERISQLCHAVGIAHVKRVAVRGRVHGVELAVDGDDFDATRKQRIGERLADAGTGAGDDSQ